MKIKRLVEFTVCDHCGSDIDKDKEYLEITIYHLKPHIDESDASYDWKHGAPVLIKWAHYADVIQKSNQEQHELISHFCNWECYMKYMIGNVEE